MRRNAPVVKRNLSGDENDGKQNIGQILARRISMGYSSFDDDNISIKSYSSIRSLFAKNDIEMNQHVYHRSGSSVGSYDWNATDNSSQKSNTLFVTVLQI